MSTNSKLDEHELHELEESLGKRGWTYTGFTPSGDKNVPGGVYRAERAGTAVVSQASTTPRGLLAAVETFERHENASKPDVHDVRRDDGS